MKNFAVRVIEKVGIKFSERETESGEPLSVLRALITNKSVDSYFTHMSEKTLENFERAARAGVTLLDSHNTSTTGYGRSIHAVREGDDLFADFGILNKAKWSSRMSYNNAEDLLYELRHRPGGFDVSVGFTNGREICDICDTDIWEPESECEHWLGERYSIRGKADPVVATAEIDNAELCETSIVFDGATDRAMFVSEERQPFVLAKAEKLYKKNKINNEHLNNMSELLRLPDLRSVGSGGRSKLAFSDRGSDPNKRSTKTMETIEGLQAQVETLTEQLEEAKTAKTELQEHYDTARSTQKEQKTRIRELEARSEILEDIEDDIRTECLDLHKEAEELREDDDRMTKEETEEFEEEIKEARYSELVRKRKTLTKDRDIVISLNNIDDKKKKDESSAGDDDDDKDGQFAQPFMYGRSNERVDKSYL